LVKPRQHVRDVADRVVRVHLCAGDAPFLALALVQFAL
jgi:hypothetical protein